MWGAGSFYILAGEDVSFGGNYYRDLKEAYSTEETMRAKLAPDPSLGHSIAPLLMEVDMGKTHSTHTHTKTPPHSNTTTSSFFSSRP